MAKDRAKQIGRKGGLKGEKSRAAVLIPERGKEIAQRAAKTRWAKSQSR